MISVLQYRQTDKHSLPLHFPFPTLNQPPWVKNNTQYRVMVLISIKPICYFRVLVCLTMKVEECLCVSLSPHTERNQRGPFKMGCSADNPSVESQRDSWVNSDGHVWLWIYSKVHPCNELPWCLPGDAFPFIDSIICAIKEAALQDGSVRKNT